MSKQEGERRFLNPNYRPEELNPLDQPVERTLGILTGVLILDAANKLSQKIEVDSLTGCFNRTHYENLKSRLDLQRMRSAEIALIFIDLNGLKNINDTFGHAKGDMIICMLACFLKMKFRKGDEIIRLGGDEFLLVCSNHENDAQFAKNLQSKIEEVQEEFKEQLATAQMPSNGFAAGVAVFDKESDSTLDDLLARADDLMYKNKESMKRTAPTSDII